MLSVFDESNNESSKVPVSFTPLESFIFLVQESISVNADFGGVNINWENIEEKTFMFTFTLTMVILRKLEFYLQKK